jgi:hypothetical protein
MRGMEEEDAARNGTNGRRPRRRRGPRDVGKLAARLAPPEERTNARTVKDGADSDDTIRVETKPTDRLPDEEEDEHGVLYMSPVVKVAVSLFLAYTIFVALLIALG